MSKTLENSKKLLIFATNNQLFILYAPTMTIKEFTDIFLPSLVQLYKNGQLDFHALLDMDIWRKIYPDSREEPHDFLWYQIKLNAFALKDGTGLIVYSLLEPNMSGERKFIGIRFDNKSRDVHYYILVRPRFYDSPWEIFQYSFASRKFVFDYVINGTHSLRDFVNTIGSHEAAMPKGLIELFKGKIRETFGMQ